MKIDRLLSHYREVWTMDTEYCFADRNSGNRPTPVCLVAHEMRSNRWLRLWQHQLRRGCPPFRVDDEALFVAYYSPAEWGFFLALDWPLPEMVLDLHTEFRCLNNGLPTIVGYSLPGALIHFGLPGIDAEEKEEMRELILTGGPWSLDEQRKIVEYCQSDVAALDRLLPAMMPRIDLQRAVYRGRYQRAVAAMEHNGVPVNQELLGRLLENWDRIRDRIIEKADAGYGIFEGRTFKYDRFESWLARNGIPWPRLESGRLDLSDDTFRQLARAFPQVSLLRELRHTLSELRLNDLTVGADGRNRAMLSSFGARTSRNTPSNSRFIFGPSVWIRNLIQPPPGHAVASIDWSQQEFGIAGVLSGDERMLAAYLSGDPYLAFAKQAGAVPADATKSSHPVERELYKACLLATQYGMESRSLAFRINQPEIVARELLRSHREVYSAFWKWRDNIECRASLYGWQETVFGWRKWLPAGFNLRSVCNFHMQGNGAEMLRLACCLGIENGIKICAPVHDAIFIESPIGRIQEDVARMRTYMAEASRIVLGGFELRTDCKIVIHPDHYSDPRGDRMWEIVTAAL